MNLSSIVENNASWNPKATAIICTETDTKYTYEEFNKLINRFGCALQEMGVQKEDRVAIYLPNSPEFLISHFAIARIGAVAVPFNVMFKGPEIKYILNNSKAKVLIAAAKEAALNVVEVLPGIPTLERVITVGETELAGAVTFASMIESGKDELEMVDCAPSDTVSILYTSGTTGQPKGAMLTHNNFLSNARLNGTRVLHVNDQDLFYTGTPFCHVFYVLSVLGPIYAGAGIVVSERFMPDKTLESISKYRVTHYAGVPTMWIYMLNEYTPEKYDVSSWRFAQSAGASMPGEYISKIENTFRVGFCECYGSTETSSTVSFGRLGHGKVASIGPPAWGYQFKIIGDDGKELGPNEVGEIVLRGPGVFKGYWEMPEATKEVLSEDGWFKTGDLGKYDEDGYYYIVDRKKDMIICGGYNIYPREIEEVLYTHPKVFEAVVIGVPDKEKGEIPKAYIKLKQGVEAEPAEIVQFCKERMAAYKSPRQVEFVDDFPKNPTGKILKRVMRE
ncbi:class I adenylate-forming enzyme family protein [Desulfoscipio gibsoniae]|uniref:Acyl-CoA synthetase (AMP-forming)/AMP-acid ligase II n=1 Tax=Desulfoscipio gibsoniae DSM 7213 TaxID=767817 RepID=R4KHM8_9FIRM|nr:long-chain fatty acid--CoA ligase [Desulfoscipio gibsoniae]AGL02114.1 acyl-CoA synthetase (AMP-forming)/AMP-acid ligase II [Desulfoscipio gibsoniae DSM 7213]